MYRIDEALKVDLHREPIDFRMNINALALLVEKAHGLELFATCTHVLAPSAAPQALGEPATCLRTHAREHICGAHGPEWPLPGGGFTNVDVSSGSASDIGVSDLTAR